MTAGNSITLQGKTYQMKDVYSLGVVLVAQSLLQKCGAMYAVIAESIDDEDKTAEAKKKAQGLFGRFMREAVVNYDDGVDFWSLTWDEFTTVRDRFFVSPSAATTKT